MNHINQFRSMVALVDHGHFGRAAESIGLTQSALSQNIQRIESLYGTQLFVRKRGRISTTAYGEVIAKTARLVIESLQQAERDIDLMKNLEIGHLVVGVDSFVGSSLVAPALSNMMVAHPNLRFTWKTGHWDSMVQPLLKEEIDMFIGFPSEHPPSEIDIQPVVVPSPVIVCSPSHELAKRDAVSLQEIIQYPIVSPFPPNWYVRWAQDQVDEIENRASVTNTMIMETESIDVCKQMTKNNHALTGLLWNDLQREVDSAEFIVLNVNNWPNLMNSCIATKSSRVPLPAALMLTQAYCEKAADAVSEVNKYPRSGRDETEIVS
jgi:DNA-binding transcriptional LysR family regulator